MSKTLQNGSFQDAVGTVVNGGTIEFVLSHDAMIIAGGQVAPTRVSATLDSSGDMPSAFTILANDELTPSGTFYLTTVFDSNGARVFGPERWVFSGASPIDLDTMTPTIVDPAFADPILSNPTAAQAIADFNFSTPFLNNVRVVDGTKFTTTQGAIDDLSSNVGLVFVPATYAGAAPTAIPDNVIVMDATSSGRLRFFTGSNDLYTFGSLEARTDGAMIATDGVGAGVLNLFLRREGPATAGKGAIIRFQSRNDAETMFDGAQINGGLETITAASENGVIDFTIYRGGATDVISLSGNLAAFTPAVGDTGAYGLGVIATAGGANNSGWKEISLEGTNPRIQFYENDRTLPAGLWQIESIDSAFVIQRNTAAAGDFSSSSNDLLIDSAGKTTLGGDLVLGSTDVLTASVVDPLEGTLSNVPRWIFKQVDFGDMTAGATADTFTLWTLPANTMIHDVVGTVVTAWAGGSISAAIASVGTNAGAANDLTLDDDFFAAATVYELHDATASGGKGALLYDATDKFAPHMFVAGGVVELQMDLTGDNHVNATAGQARIYALVSQPLGNTTVEAN